MEKKKVFILIFLSFLVSNAVCKEEPNNLSTESLSEVNARFTNPSARHADEPLRSGQHNLPVHTSPNTDSFTSDDERISLLLDGKILLASKDDLKPPKLAKNVIYADKIENTPTVRKSLSRLRKQKKVFASSHGARRTTASVFGDVNGKDSFAFKNTPPSFGTGEQPYKMEINTPFKLTILPTEETVTPSIDTTDGESDWILTPDDSAEKDEEKSSHSNDHKDDASAKSGPKVTGHEGKAQHGGTSAIPQHKMAVHPGMKTSSGFRWNVAYEHGKLDESKKGKRFKKKKKTSDSRTEDSADSDSSAVSVAGILTGILMLLFIFTGVPRLWNILKNRWRRRYKRELKLNIPSTGYLSEELSEEEVFFDRTAMGRNKKSFMATNPKSTPNAPPRQPKSAPVSSQSTDHETQEQIIWTLSETPKSTPLMAVPTLTENMPSTEIWTVNEIPESQSLDSSSKESSSLVLLPAASDELVCTVSIATDSTSSFTESCKAPVAPRHEVVISIDDDDDEETIYTSEKSQCEKWNTVKDADKGTNREVAIRMEPDDGKDRSLLLSESESPGVLINTSVKLETNNLNTDDAVIDIRSREDENEELLAVNDNSKDDEPHLTSETKPSPTASAERRRGKSLIGGRKALENRRFIKHLISGQESTGFKNDLNKAISRILGENKSLEDKNRGKRNVIKHQTQETKYSLAESISRTKSLIMNENVDKEREKRSFLCRQTIKHTLSNPVRPAVRSKRSLAREIAFAKEIILPARAHPRAAVRTKAKREVRPTKVLDRGASASNTRAKTKYMNHKDYQNWKLLQKDGEMKKAKGVKPDGSLPSMKQIASFFNIFIPDVDYDVTVCQCYYCDKHRRRDRAKRLLKLSW